MPPPEPMLRQTSQALDRLRDYVWFQLLSPDKQLAIAKVCSAIVNGQSGTTLDERRKTIAMLEQLMSAVSDHQRTLCSLGWNKAVAQKHQYDRVEFLLKKAEDHLLSVSPLWSSKKQADSLCPSCGAVTVDVPLPAHGKGEKCLACGWQNWPKVAPSSLAPPPFAPVVCPHCGNSWTVVNARGNRKCAKCQHVFVGP